MTHTSGNRTLSHHSWLGLFAVATWAGRHAGKHRRHCGARWSSGRTSRVQPLLIRLGAQQGRSRQGTAGSFAIAAAALSLRATSRMEDKVLCSQVLLDACSSAAAQLS